MTEQTDVQNKKLPVWAVVAFCLMTFNWGVCLGIWIEQYHPYQDTSCNQYTTSQPAQSPHKTVPLDQQPLVTNTIVSPSCAPS